MDGTGANSLFAGLKIFLPYMGELVERSKDLRLEESDRGEASCVKDTKPWWWWWKASVHYK